MHYSVHPDVFTAYPGFMRAVAERIDNTGENARLANALRACERGAREDLGDDFKSHPRLAVRAAVFRGMCINPNKYPPSVTNLVKRVRAGKDLPYINSLVAAFNYISLRHLCPCGGDDPRGRQRESAADLCRGHGTLHPARTAGRARTSAGR